MSAAQVLEPDTTPNLHVVPDPEPPRPTPASFTTDEPAVLAWMIAMAPRPRLEPRRHWWRDLVTDAFRSANHAWWLEREAAAIGYASEEAEWEATHPRPRLGDFMTHLSSGRWSPLGQDEDDAQHALDAVLPALREAWDDGYYHGAADERDDPGGKAKWPNPYRVYPPASTNAEEA